MSGFFVTNSTLKSIAFMHSNDINISMDKVWLQLVITGLKDFFTPNEAKQIFAGKLIIESRLEVASMEAKRYNQNEIFATKAPRFHTDHQCKLMHKDYENLEVPPQISALGTEKVREFQLYCEENKAEIYRLSSENRVDVFWARVGLRFGVTGINPQEVLVENSSVVNFDMRSRSAQAVEEEIYSFMDELRAMERNAEHGIIVKKFKHAPSYKRALKSSGLADNDMGELYSLRKLFDLKESIKDKLFQLYSLQSDTKPGLLPEEILIHSGIEPCSACCA